MPIQEVIEAPVHRSTISKYLMRLRVTLGCLKYIHELAANELPVLAPEKKDELKASQVYAGDDPAIDLDDN